MTAKELLLVQTRDTYAWINKLAENIPQEKWGILPDDLNTSMKWQIGHLIMSGYYHAVMVITGPQNDVPAKIPLKKYNDYFVFGDRMSEVDTVVAVDALKGGLNVIRDKVISVIEKLPEEALHEDLFPLPFPHPVAKKKLEALSWNIKHNMWHCGQISTLARILENPYDFKLRDSFSKK